MASVPEIAGIGYCCIDELLLLSEIPLPEGRAVIRRRQRQGGGMVATAMVAAARLGAEAGFAGAVGDDERGAWILDDFRRYGVDVSRTVVRAGATSHLTVVLVDGVTGARSFLSDRGTVAGLEASELAPAFVTGARLLHLSDAGEAAQQAARWARDAGTEVCFDGTHFAPSILALLPLVDYLIVSRFFASEFAAYRAGKGLGSMARQFLDPDGAEAGHVPQEPIPAASGEALLEIARTLRDTGPSTVVVTEGERGSWCASVEGEFHTPALPVRAVDTTGAGDVFHGAFLFARARGWELRPALRLASATASLKCRALGGRAGIPTLEQAMAAMAGEI